MPIYKVTVKEEITRWCVAYVDAPDDAAADKWAADAPDFWFVPDDARERADAEISKIEKIDAAPDGDRVRKFK